MSSPAIVVWIALQAIVQPVDTAAPISRVATAAIDSERSDPPLAPGFVRLPAALPVAIEIADAQGSNTSRIDDLFAIRIRVPVVVEGKVVIPVGAVGQGQVIHAARSSGFGKAGELILAARFVDCGGVRVALRGMRFESSGNDKSGQVMGMYSVAAPLAGVLATPLLFISGGKVAIPAGTPAYAKLAAATDLPANGCAAPIAAPPAP